MKFEQLQLKTYKTLFSIFLMTVFFHNTIVLLDENDILGAIVFLPLTIISSFYLLNICEFKKLYFKFISIYFFVSIINYLGYDDKDIILSCFSPYCWSIDFLRIFISFKIYYMPKSIIYLSNIIFAIIFGKLVEKIHKKIQSFNCK